MGATYYISSPIHLCDIIFIKSDANMEHESDGSSMKKQIIEIKKEKEVAKWRLICPNK